MQTSWWGNRAQNRSVSTVAYRYPTKRNSKSLFVYPAQHYLFSPVLFSLHSFRVQSNGWPAQHTIKVNAAKSPDVAFCARQREAFHFALACPQQQGTWFHLQIVSTLSCSQPRRVFLDTFH